MNITVGEFKETGINEIDVELVISKWNHLWVILQWKDTFRIVKYLRKDSPNVQLKLTISEEQAMEIIGKLSLNQIPSAFKSGSSWA